MRKSTMFTSFAAASLALSTSAALVAQPAETPASDNSATPATPAEPATPAAKEDPLSPDTVATTEEAKPKDDKKKAAKKPR